MDVNTERVYRDWLTLCLAKDIGPSTCKKLLAEFKKPQNILDSSDCTLSSFGLSDAAVKSLNSPDLEKIDKVLEWGNQSRHHLITIHDEDYPELLKGIHSAPIILFAVGQRQVLNNICFAIVGSRNPSSGGKKLAESFAYDLAKSGFVICSGLALGIDYQSHLGALRAECSTIAILGNGLNRIYPARHKNIAAQITENGLLVSEFFPDTKPSPGNFPRRNRIISGMSVGVLVVEAAKKSGSLITANYALEQGREVFAIPGSIHNPLARGTHSLIKQGAKLVETTEDIFEEVQPLVSAAMNESIELGSCGPNDIGLDTEYKRLLDCMGYDIVSVDFLVESSGLTPDAVSSMLLILELEGVIESRHGGKYSRCS